MKTDTIVLVAAVASLTGAAYLLSRAHAAHETELGAAEIHAYYQDWPYEEVATTELFGYVYHGTLADPGEEEGHFEYTDIIIPLMPGQYVVTVDYRPLDPLKYRVAQIEIVVKSHEITQVTFSFVR